MNRNYFLMTTKRCAAAILCIMIIGLTSCPGDDDDTPPDESGGEQSEPSCHLMASPDKGEAPLKIFYSTVAFDSYGKATKFEVDFDGDGVYDLTSTTELSAKEYVFETAGIYEMQLRVTYENKKTATSKKTITVTERAYKYPGFSNIQLANGAYWKYKWEYVTKERYGAITTGTKTGFQTMTINGAPVKVSFVNNIGELTLYPLKHESSGANTYEFPWKNWTHIAMKDGILYLIVKDAANYTAYTVFNSYTGAYNTWGFTRYMDSKGTITVSASNFTSPYSTTYTGSGVRAYYSYSKPECEVIAGVRVCDGTSISETLSEYYLPNIGFCGFTRTTSMTTGASNSSSEMWTWLVETNLKK